MEHLNVRNVHYHWIMSEGTENVTSYIYARCNIIWSAQLVWFFPTKQGRNERASILQLRHHSLTLIPHCASDLCGRTASCANLKWVWIGSSLNSCDQSGSVAWQEQDGIGENLFGNFEFIRPPSCFTPSFFHDWFLLRIVIQYVPELSKQYWTHIRISPFQDWFCQFLIFET